MNYKLSVVIPTYKRTESLSRLLNLLKQQTIEKDIQIIVIDQNEKGFLSRELDESILIGIQHLYQEEPNVSSARNYGAKCSSGEFILFLDDDTIPEADFCEKGISMLNVNKYIKILTPTLLRRNEKAKDILPKKIINNLYLLSLKEKNLHASFFTISACTFYHKDTFLKTGGFDPYLFKFARAAEDQEFFIRLINNNFNVYLSTDLQILIDEDVAGGCELRTEDYWLTRKKCIRAWAYRYRIHNIPLGKLTLKDIILLSRHTFLNSAIFHRSFKNTIKQISTLTTAVRESKIFIQPLLSQNLLNNRLNHLK